MTDAGRGSPTTPVPARGLDGYVADAPYAGQARRSAGPAPDAATPASLGPLPTPPVRPGTPPPTAPGDDDATLLRPRRPQPPAPGTPPPDDDATLLRPRGPRLPASAAAPPPAAPDDATLLQPRRPQPPVRGTPPPDDDATVLRPRGPADDDATLLRPRGPAAPAGGPPAPPDLTAPPSAPTGDDATLLGPRPVRPVAPDEATLLAPRRHQVPPTDDATLLRPGGPRPPAVDADATLLGPRAGHQPPAEEATLLRPGGPGQPVAPTAAPASPTPVADLLAGSPTPPSGFPVASWRPPSPPESDDDRTEFVPHIEVPKAVFGSANAGASRFAPPEERPGVPDVEPPQERFAPRPIPGMPMDLPVGGRFEAPPAQAPEKPRSRRSAPDWMLWVAAVLVVVLIGSTVWWRFLRPTTIDEAIIVPTASATERPKVQRGEDAVRGYLQALAAGDITAALAYGPVGPGSQVLLAPAAVQESLALAPISNIDVPDAAENASVIRARYTIGTDAVDRTFNVERTDDGGWQLTKSTTTVQLTAKRSARVPLLINKQPVDNLALLELVPGTYRFETGLPFLRYVTGTDLKVQSLDYNQPIQTLNLELTDEGRTALLEAGRTSMQACLAQTVLDPPGCPFGKTSDKPVRAVRWEELKDPWNGVQFTPTIDDPSVAEATFTISVAATVDFADGSHSPGNKVEITVRMTADVTKSRAQDIQVRWADI